MYDSLNVLCALACPIKIAHKLIANCFSILSKNSIIHIVLLLINWIGIRKSALND